MTPRDLRKRLEAQGKFFKFETEFVKAKMRDLYRLAQDAIKLAERLEGEVIVLRNPKLTEQQKDSIAPIVATQTERVSNPAEPESKLDRLRAFLAGPIDDPKFERYLRVTGMTIDDAIKYVESEGQNT